MRAASAPPTAIGKDGVGHVKQVTEWHKNVPPNADPDVVAYAKRFTGKEDDFSYWRAARPCSRCSPRP